MPYGKERKKQKPASNSCICVFLMRPPEQSRRTRITRCDLLPELQPFAECIGRTPSGCSSLGNRDAGTRGVRVLGGRKDLNPGTECVSFAGLQSPHAPTLTLRRIR